jgi:hypothetical protein
MDLPPRGLAVPTGQSCLRPMAWNDPPVEAVPDWGALAQPEYVFDQQMQW